MLVSFEIKIMSIESFSSLTKEKNISSQATESETENEANASHLSFEELSNLQKTIESLEGKVAFARGRKSDIVKSKTFDEIRNVFSQYPDIISQGLQYEETALITLQLISTLWDVTKKRDEDHFGHFSEREGTDDAVIAEMIESKVIESEQSMQKILGDEKNTTERKMAFEVVSGLLDSSVEHHREYGEMMLGDHIPVLTKLLSDQIRISPNDEIVHVWQEMFLRFQNPKNLRHIASMFEAVWDQRIRREEKEKQRKKEAGEEIQEGRDWNDLYNNFFQKIFHTYAESFVLNKDFILKMAINITGLNGSKIMREWMDASDGSQKQKMELDHQYAYAYNLKALYELKQASPVAPQALNAQFGITHFGRYTRDMLLKQYEERNEKNPYGIILFPIADHNGAFFNSALQFDQVQKTLREKNCLIRIIEAGSQEAIARRLIRLDRTYNRGDESHKISFALIGGHGTERSIHFGEEEGNLHTLITKEDISRKSIMKGAKNFFDPGSQTVLLSCSTGAEEGIAQEMFMKLGFSMQAPKKSAHLSNILVSFDEEHKPNFEVVYEDHEGNSVSTMSYQSSQKNDISKKE